MTPEEAFAIYLNYSPELEFLNGGDSEDKAFTESMLAIVPDIADLEIFLDEADNLYHLAARGFFDQIVKPFETELKVLLCDKYAVNTKRKTNKIDGDYYWRIKSKDGHSLFEVGFLFRAKKEKCIATPWFWRVGNGVKLTLEELEKKLKDKFSIPRSGNWRSGALVAKSVEYGSTDNIEQLNKNLMSPISFALNKIVRHLERQEKIS